MSREMKDSGISWIGEIPSDWRIGHLKRLARIKTGSTPSRSVEEYYSEKSGLPWIKPENLNSYDSVENTAEYLTAEGRVAGTVFPQNTVFACCIASIGKIGYSNIEASCNQQINGLIYNDLINWKYGFYSNVAANNEYLARANSSVQFILNSTNQGYIQMPIPSIAEQEIISTFLDSKCAAIDQAIQKQKDIVDKLMEYKQSTITQAVTKGLNPSVEMKDSGIDWIREIPSNWYTQRFKFFHTCANVGISLDKNYWSDNDCYDVFYTAGEKHIYSSFSDFPLDKYTTEQDLLLSRNGTPYVYYPKTHSQYSDHIIRTNIFPKYCKRFVFYCLQQSILSDTVDSVSIPTWSISIWDKQILTVPPLDEQKSIATFLDSKCSKINESIEQSNKIVQKLEEYKKALIYNAVTGKIDCRNA